MEKGPTVKYNLAFLVAFRHIVKFEVHSLATFSEFLLSYLNQ